MRFPGHFVDLTFGKMKTPHLLFLLFFFLCIGCTNQDWEKAVLLDKELAATSILSTSFDSLFQETQTLSSQRSFSQEEQWKIKRIRAALLNGRGLQEQYLPLWFDLLKEHRAADRPVFIIKDLYAIANHFAMLGDQEQAIALYKEAYQLAIDNQLPELQGRCFVSWVNLLCEIGRYAEVVGHYNKVEIDSVISPHSFTYSILAECYLQLHKPDSARFYLFKEQVSKRAKGIAINCRIAETYIAENREDSAAFFLEKAMNRFGEQAKLCREKNIKASLPSCFLPFYSSFAGLLQRNGKTQRAKESFTLVEPLMEEYTQDPLQIKMQTDALTRYSSFCRTTQQYEKALDLLARRDSIQQIYNDIRKRRDSKNLVDRFQFQELMYTINLQKAQLIYSQRILAVVLVFTFVLIFGIAVCIRLFQQRRKQLAVINHQGQEIQTLQRTVAGNKRTLDPQEVVFRKAGKEMASQELFLDSKLSLESLAKTLGTNRSYLSSCINLYSGGNFNQWINSYRVRYMLKHIHSAKSLPELAQKAGFVSPASFHRNFKECTGLTPQQYLKQQKSPDAEADSLS